MNTVKVFKIKSTYAYKKYPKNNRHADKMALTELMAISWGIWWGVGEIGRS